MSRRKERLYHVYYGIKARCYNSKTPKFNLYGGKGIVMCDEWLSDYESFKRWSYDNGFQENSKLSIDRIDSNGDYSLENCQWISLSQNSGKANIGRQKYKSKRGKMIAVDPHGHAVEITNVSGFCRDNKLNRGCVSHRLNGFIHNQEYCGWNFYRESN